MRGLVIIPTLGFLVLAACSRPSLLLPQNDIELRNGETHVYQLWLPEGQYMLLNAASRIVDLKVSLVAPVGESLADVQVPAWSWRPEALAVVTPAAGVYELRVHGLTPTELKAACGANDETPLAGETPPGSYRLRHVVKRPAGNSDHVVAKALQAHAAGVKLSECNETAHSRQALEQLRQTQALWQDAGSQEDLELLARRAETLYWIGVVQTDLKQYGAALSSFHQALEFHRHVGDSGRVADSLYRIGEVYRRRGEYRQALDPFRRALAAYQRRGELKPEAFTQINLGYIEKQLTQLHAALDHYLPALRLLRQLQLPKWELTTLINIGSAYQEMGDIERAREYFHAALPVSRHLGQRASEASIMNHIGWGFLLEPGQAHLARKWLEEAVSVAEEVGNQRRLAIYLEKLGQAHLKLGNLATALQLCERAFLLSEGESDPHGQAIGLIGLGLVQRTAYEVALAKGRTGQSESERSLRSLERALALSRSAEDRTGEVEAQYQLALLRRAEGDLDAALTLVLAAVEVIEEVRRDIAGQDLRASYLALQRSVYELWVELLMILAETVRRDDSLPPTEKASLSRRRIAAAFAAHEWARARSLLESVPVAVAHTGVDPALLDSKRRLYAELDRWELERLGLGPGGSRPPPGVVKTKIRDLRQDLEAVEGQIRSLHPDEEVAQNPRLLRLEEVQDQVMDGESLFLEYALGAERSFLFAITSKSFDVFELPPKAEIEKLAIEVHELLADVGRWNGTDTVRRQHAERYRDAVAGLGERLLAPVGAWLTGQRLLVAAEGALWYIPFAVLPSPSDGQPLVLDHEVVYVPSASVMAALRKRLSARVRAPGILAVLADPVFDTNDPRVADGGAGVTGTGTATVLRSARDAGLSRFERLVGAGSEAEQIAALVPPEERMLAVAFDASRERATSGELSRFQILHFATHGLLNNRHPELSGLVMSLVDQQGRPRDGFLRLYDISQLRLHADLVVLSACRTALGRRVRGEGLLGLTRSFLAAGAERVVASLWQVEDRATAMLMTRFYQHLLIRKLRPEAALREAQIELLRGDAGRRWRTPNHWAAFTLQGEWREPG